MTDPGAPDTKDTTWHVALLGGFAQREPWRMRRRTVAVAPVGGIDLDLTQATLPGGDLVVVKVSLIGGAKLRVPSDVSVVLTGFNLVGGRRNDAESAVAGGPTVRLHAYGVIGGVRVERA